LSRPPHPRRPVAGEPVYCSLDDITRAIPLDAVIDLTDDDRAGAVDQSRVNEAVSAASSLIDGFCGMRYSVPMNPVPALIRCLAADIAIYNLYARRHESIPDTRRARYEDALSVLEKIVRGQAILDVPPPPSPAANAASSSFVAPGRVFTRETLDGCL